MVQPLKGIHLQQPWRGWIEKLTTAANAAATKIPGMAIGNVFIADADGDLADSGSPLPSGTLVDADYVGEKYITDAPLREAGEEEGARHGSFRIGLLTEDDYAFFDENGKLIFYGTAGLQLITPLNLATSATMFAVLDSSGNLKYRTASQIVSDLNVSITPDARQWASERFITENLLDEAEADDSFFRWSDDVADDDVFNLPTISNAALGMLVIGADDERAFFSIASTGTVNLMIASANVVANANTDGRFCIGIAAGLPITVRNRLGSKKKVLFLLWPI